MANAFRQGIRDLGYVEGKTIALEVRWAEGSYERMPGLVAELVGLKVDVLVATNGDQRARPRKLPRPSPSSCLRLIP
jgi:putative ABC transport system substrate-binding protein